jgi:sulfate transport system permease protein
MGLALTYISVIVLIPLASIVIVASDMGLEGFFKIVTGRRIMAGFRVSFLCTFIAAAINAVFGVILAWVLVRYKFPFKRLLDGLIELPFALPTAVAGISLTALYHDRGLIGGLLADIGVKIAYTRIGIIIALVFITVPFVVRTIQPVLEKLDPQYEEAARMLGAGRTAIFFRVIFPEILPALLTGFGLAFARGLGEYGSVVFIAGNTPFKTEIAPLLIMSKLQQFDYAGATSIALVMIIASFLVLLLINTIQLYFAKFVKE